MRLTVLCLVALLALGVPALARAQAAPSAGVRGLVTDSSAGVLPGVVVSAVAAGGRALETTVTNGTGEFSFDHLPAGAIDLVFHLDGFDDGHASVTAQPGPAPAVRIVQQLQVKAHSETVVVRAQLPAPPPPRPVLQPVPEHDESSVCGPSKAEGIVQAPGTVRSRRDETMQGMFGAGDELVVDGGEFSGIHVGDNFIVRRRYPTALVDRKGKTVMGEHSSGLVQIVSADDQSSTAVVVYACDEIMSGDYLARFDAEPMTEPESEGKPAYDAAARILFADVGQSFGLANRMLVIDRGTIAGVAPGQRFTLFRPSRFNRATPVVLGEAVVVAVRRESATILVEQATDVVEIGDDGDWAAPQRAPLRASQ